MLNLKASSVIHNLVNQFLIDGTVRNDKEHALAMHICLDCRMDYFDSKEKVLPHSPRASRGLHHSPRASRGLHLLYYKRYNNSSYITVFSAVTGSPFTKLEKVDNWKHETTHDSCWRDISIFSQVYFDLANEINSQRVYYGLPEVAPIMMHESNSFGGINGPMFQWVPVEVITDPNDPNNYKKLVKLL